MAGLVPAIHVFVPPKESAWMPGTSPGMTTADGPREIYTRLNRK